MILRQTLDKPHFGYWDGGDKQVFDWSIEGHIEADSIGKFVRISSYDANHWFSVAVGKTDKLTLSYAKLHLRAVTKVACSFQYVWRDNDQRGANAKSC